MSGLRCVERAFTLEWVQKNPEALTAIAWLEDVSAKYRRDDLMDDAARVDAGIRERAGDGEDALTRYEIRTKCRLSKWKPGSRS